MDVSRKFQLVCKPRRSITIFRSMSEYHMNSFTIKQVKKEFQNEPLCVKKGLLHPGHITHSKNFKTPFFRDISNLCQWVTQIDLFFSKKFQPIFLLF